MLPEQRLVFIRHAANFRSPVSLVGIGVRDMRASLEVYRLLGLEIPEVVEDEPDAVKVVARLFVRIYECGVHTSTVRLHDRPRTLTRPSSSGSARGRDFDALSRGRAQKAAPPARRLCYFLLVARPKPRQQFLLGPFGLRRSIPTLRPVPHLYLLPVALAPLGRVLGQHPALGLIEQVA